MTVCSLHSQISPASENRALIHHETVKSLRHGQFLISSLSHGYCDVCFVGKLLILGNLTCAQEPRWLRVAWWTRTWTQGNRVVNIAWQYMDPQIVYWLRVSGVWNYPVGWAYLKVFKTFVICKKVSKLAVTYAPSLGRLWSTSMRNNTYLLTLQANCATICHMRKHTTPTRPQLTSSDCFVFLGESLAKVLTNQSAPVTKARFQNKNKRPRCIRVSNGPLNALSTICLNTLLRVP